MLACTLASKPCSEVTNIGYPLSSAAVFGMPRMARSRVMEGRFGGEVGRFLLALREMRKFEIYKEYLIKFPTSPPNPPLGFINRKTAKLFNNYKPCNVCKSIP